jgi:hypothetical protein
VSPRRQTGLSTLLILRLTPEPGLLFNSSKIASRTNATVAPRLLSLINVVDRKGAQCS